MHSREDVELALMALEEGWTRSGRGRGRMAPGEVREEAPMNESERAAHGAAMTERV